MSQRRVDELLTELTELVETARTMPMSSSCLVPREQVLDLLDSLRDALPPEMTQARQLVVERDAMLASAQAEAGRIRRDTEAEQARLVSASEVHRRAVEQAEVVAAQAAAAAAATAREADAYAERMRTDARAFADKTLAELIEVLERSRTVAANGRTALASDS